MKLLVVGSLDGRRLVARACPFFSIVFGITLAGMTPAALGQVAITTSYSENFNGLGSGLPTGWGVWTSSTATTNGTAFSWNTAQIANDASASAANYFRNVPGASQTWSSSLSSGTDRALGWRAGSAPSRDGSITFTLNNTAGYNLQSLSFTLFTPNSSGTAVPVQLQYQIGSGTFTNFNPTPIYTTNTPLNLSSITLTSMELAAVSNQSSQVTFRIVNTFGSGSTAFDSLAIDNFSYSASAVSAIPEPSTYALIVGAAALGGSIVWRRRKTKAVA